MPNASPLVETRGLMKIGVLAFLLLVASQSQTKAETADERALKAYRLTESDAKAQLDSAFEAAKVEKKRKQAAGEPPASAKQMKDGIDGVKFLIYNKAAINGICFSAALNASADFGTVKACVEKRNAAMVKYIKLTDYATLPSSRTGKNCELLARDFDNETRFPPFEFLRFGLGPPLFNFETINDCLMSDH